ncbi:nucleotidyl transferase AbiEii/AbiGii toxin family protein [Deinococcus sp. QL22]|uniref:nucleotidyl transferase AbiEii/AbiGii toxin family protein n=1 Tax=Deinococcus sp. QL22 TaxID=2939437 RepID=UPI002017C232|nr:nucleotidyl transferase AbiEii/AbiGii toxin family protein [Deinococcus sp. QL22]UQN10670.1 nucleotidyl transferase AbiEii/AbiGii toxin family protein [Deinococcus sp. QL22]
MSGPSELQPLLRGWLRRAGQHPATSDWVLRGSLVTRTLCGQGRVPADVDYLVSSPYQPDTLAAVIAEVAQLSDYGTRLTLTRTEAIWAETSFPGLRAFLVGQHNGQEQHFQVDFSFGDPMAQAAVTLLMPEVGPVLACPAETLWAWKLHGLVEFGPGKWRGKDLYDLHLLQTSLRLDFSVLPEVVVLAFSSRQTPLSDLDELRTRDSWGCSVSNGRKWRTFQRRAGVQAEFLEVRNGVRAVVDTVMNTALTETA